MRFLRSSIAAAAVAALAVTGASSALAHPRDDGAPSDAERAAGWDPTLAPEGETHVGVPDDARLTSRPGGVLRGSGQTLESVVITGDLLVGGSDVTLRNVRVEGHLVIRRGSGVVLESSEVGALSISGAQDVVVSGVEVFGSPGRDGIHVTSGTGQAGNVRLADVWIHSPKVTARSHYDGIQVRGVEGLTLERVRVDLGDWKRQHNAALFLENANGGNSDVSVLDSWLGGGGYTLYAAGAQGVVIEDTVFAGGRWGTLYPRLRGAEIVSFEGNTDASGAAVALRGSAIG